jgi:hypothetical protein
MKNKNLAITLFLAFATLTNTAAFADGGCRKCQLIRSENATKTNPYPYYEDYLKTQGHSDNKQDRQNSGTGGRVDNNNNNNNNYYYDNDNDSDNN